MQCGALLSKVRRATLAKMTQQKTSKIALRVEPELRDRLEAAAELDRRPMANLIRAVLEDWIDSQAQGERVSNGGRSTSYANATSRVV